MIQGICAINALLWMSAIDSNTPIPSIITVISMVVAFVTEKKNSTTRLQAKNRAKNQN